MKYLIISLLFPFLFAVNTADTNTLQWNENRPLTWSDFKANPPRITRGMVAETQWSWDWEEVQMNGEYVLMPICYFNYNGSWSTVDDAYILKHEQLHYDIGELYVRKLRKKFLEDPSALNDSYRLNKLFKKYFNLCVEEQHNYDHETDHSIKKTQQIQWNKKIEAELIKFKQYDYQALLEKN